MHFGPLDKLKTIKSETMINTMKFEHFWLEPLQFGFIYTILT